MQSKSLLIAIAAFAVTATSVQAYGGTSILEKAGLTEDQISAFETAREKRQSGDFVGARDTLIRAGVDENVLHSVHKASRETRDVLKKERNITRTQERHTTKNPVRGVKVRNEFRHLTDVQQDALRVARQSNNKTIEQAILDETGL